MNRWLVTMGLLFSVVGCSSPQVQLNPDAKQVELKLSNHIDSSQCHWKGEVTGTEGHWYSSLFYNNDAMTQGAIFDIKNNAALLGADTVYLLSPLDFQTSVTFFGSAYQCKLKSQM
ncbi:DUF4156 domain-containing protein [Vibrio sp. ZSDZ34]|uniref:DUF4156 domain-containing protein n=1 Tax=Vibrio gelatinilyticus TaxID=2893468 RepID=A0A9X1WE48_9VIBR|nr:DUF4156 domain-containing protein [Vibrio gelatinilyticus]MCJ2377765.1 DUF4156 domain-containing protein [Vibrio gelatinilyticus]